MAVSHNATCPKCSGPATQAFIEIYCMKCDGSTSNSTKIVKSNETYISHIGLIFTVFTYPPPPGTLDNYKRGYWAGKGGAFVQEVYSLSGMWEISPRDRLNAVVGGLNSFLYSSYDLVVI